MNYWLLILTIAFGACKARRLADQYLQTHILGTWTEANDSNQGALRFVRADTFTKLNRGYTFYGDSTVTMHVPWGCQTPPFYREMSAKWKINNKGQIVINAPLYEKPVYWNVLSLTAKEWRYIPSKS